MGTITLQGSHGRVIDLARSDLDGFRGQVLAPNDEGYDAARSIWNTMIDRRPGLILRCTGTADVIVAVRFASEHDLLVSVRGGGHNIAGSALCDGGVMIDLSPMRAAQVWPGERRAAVQGGALLGDLDHETQAFGLAVPTGINSTTGVAGLALGAGFGWLSRAFGHAADNMLAADVVTADGALRHVSEAAEPDLFWALRGGGGNFGVVTNFEFRCHPVGPSFLSGPVLHRLEDARDVLREYRVLARELPDEATCWTVLRLAPPLPFLDPKHHGRPVLILVMTYAGEIAAGEAALARLRAIGTPLADGVSPHPYARWQAAFDGLLGPGARNYWKSHDLTDFTDEAIELMVRAAEALPDEECEIFTAQLGGAAGRISSDAIAFPHRTHQYTVNMHGRWRDPAKDEACIAWVRTLFAAMAPHATGSVYSNFVPEAESRTIGPYGANLPRLEAIKKRFDPENRFRTNVNIAPGS
jgi:FAD/FMN-containing dehydrogenase